MTAMADSGPRGNSARRAISMALLVFCGQPLRAEAPVADGASPHRVAADRALRRFAPGQAGHADPARAAGPVTRGSISGRVTGPAAVSGQVRVFDAGGGTAAYAPIGAGGTWFAQLNTGTYYAKTFNTSGMIDEAWDDQPCPFSGYPNPRKDCAASPIVVTGETTGIDFVLVAGGRVSGVVVASATSAPISNADVYIVDGQDRPRAHGRTDAGGVFTTDQGLPTGTYYARTHALGLPPAPGFLDKAYDGVPCAFSCAGTLTPILVTSPLTATGINFALDPAGAVSGTVTDESTTLPVPGVEVLVFTATGVLVWAGESAADGTYAVTGLPTGPYKAVASKYSYPSYVPEVWNNHVCVGDCDPSVGNPIHVSNGTTSAGIDFALGTGGSISGRVTRSDTAAGIEGASVVVGTDTGSYLDWWQTDASGNYTIDGLAPGNYLLWTASAVDASLNFVDQLYSGVPCARCQGGATGGGNYLDYTGLPDHVDRRSATPVTVASGTTTSGIDFVLDPGGQISGTVTRAGSGAVVFGRVDVYSGVGFAKVGTARIASGAYVVPGLPSGRYVVAAFGESGEVPRLYGDLPVDRLAHGAPVDVTTGQTTSGIDVALPLGGRIAGKITRSDTGRPPSAATRITVLSGAGRQLSVANAFETGLYTTGSGLPTGTYFVLAESPWTLSPRLYEGIDCLHGVLASSADLACDPAAGDPVSVIAPSITTGIDFVLSPAGSISGAARDAGTGLGVPGLSVSAIAVTASGRRVTRDSQTGLEGEYSLVGLPPGGYFVKVDGMSSGYVDEIYMDIICPGCDVRGGQRVDVRADTATTHIDFSLSRGGAISGTVVKPGGVFDTTVEAYSATGALARSASAAADGSYTIEGLPAGSYRLLAMLRGPAFGQLYSGVACPNRACDVTAGTPVSVTTGVTTAGIDVTFPATGAISGHVWDAVGRPAWGGRVFSFAGGLAWVQADGHYRLSDIPAGNHYVGTAVEGLVNEIHDNLPCAGCDPGASGATPVTVMGGAEASGIDFTLDVGGSISGKVASAGRGLGEVPIRLKKAGALDSYAAATTRDDGTYEVLGLAPGTYYAAASREGFDVQLYSGLPCPQTCDPTTGTPITVSGTGSVAGIDFNLVPHSLSFYTLPPCRVLDTRNAWGGLGGPALACTGDRNFPVAGTCGVPFDAKALSLNLTATGSTAQGHLRLHPGRSAVATTSSLNYAAGQTRANNAILPLGSIGEVGIYCGQGSGTTHAIVDVNGYFK